MVQEITDVRDDSGDLEESRQLGCGGEDGVGIGFGIDVPAGAQGIGTDLAGLGRGCARGGYCFRRGGAAFFKKQMQLLQQGRGGGSERTPQGRAGHTGGGNIHIFPTLLVL